MWELNGIYIFTAKIVSIFEDLILWFLLTCIMFIPTICLLKQIS